MSLNFVKRHLHQWSTSSRRAWKLWKSMSHCTKHNSRQIWRQEILFPQMMKNGWMLKSIRRRFQHGQSDGWGYLLERSNLRYVFLFLFYFIFYYVVLPKFSSVRFSPHFLRTENRTDKFFSELNRTGTEPFRTGSNRWTARNFEKCTLHNFTP